MPKGTPNKPREKENQENFSMRLTPSDHAQFEVWSKEKGLRGRAELMRDCTVALMTGNPRLLKRLLPKWPKFMRPDPEPGTSDVEKPRKVKQLLLFPEFKKFTPKQLPMFDEEKKS